MDFLLELFGEFVFEVVGEAFSGVLVFSGRSMREAFAQMLGGFPLWAIPLWRS